MFLRFLDAYPAFDAFYDRLRAVPRRRGTAPADPVGDTLTAATLADVMTANPVAVSPATSIRDAARTMQERNISCVLVVDDGRLAGILTTGDLTNRVVAGGVDPGVPVASVMTRDPFSLEPEALVFDAMLAMSARQIGHLPITRAGAPIGILTRTNLLRRQTVSAVYMVADIARTTNPTDMAAIVANVPQLLAQLVGAGVEAWKVGHIVTSIADAATRRLLALAEEKLGPPPVPYLWLACGSQGRREQTGVSDQDNCLILDDAFEPAAHDPYFKALARWVSDGLNTCGYVYCPGDMMATADRWRQPVRVWRRYFSGWIARPDPMAQMLSSVMFDLRPISGATDLFAGLQRETLDAARKNSIFRAHMISNSLKHTPPLGLFRGFALIRSGEHKDTVDLKHSGIVPIVDLARVYALDAAIEAVNTRDRLLAAREAGTVSRSGADDLVAAYDLIANIRLEHQARQVRAGERPDNYLAPNSLSPLERNYLKDAFGVVKTLQSALAGRAAP
jgi:CBS domain-containing protein